jgi:hypothetical protein
VSVFDTLRRWLRAPVTETGDMGVSLALGDAGCDTIGYLGPGVTIGDVMTRILARDELDGAADVCSRFASYVPVYDRQSWLDWSHRYRQEYHRLDLKTAAPTDYTLYLLEAWGDLCAETAVIWHECGDESGAESMARNARIARRAAAQVREALA